MTRPVLPQPAPNYSDDPTTAPLTVGAGRGCQGVAAGPRLLWRHVARHLHMHGITKEIHRAVRASALEERSQPSDEDAKSEHAYRGLLQSLRKERDVHTRIVVDAHINRDPPAALVEPCKKLGLDLRASSPQHRDCKRIDAIL